jgi:hypothetical protein
MDGARRVDHINSDRRKTHQVSARLRLAKLIGALDIALAPHLVHLLPRLRCRIVTAVGSRVRGKVNVNVGSGHARSRHCGERAGEERGWDGEAERLRGLEKWRRDWFTVTARWRDP